MPNFSRRQLLLAGSTIGLGSFVFSQGLRYPRMGFEPENPASKIVSALAQLELSDCVYTGQHKPISIRAIAPEPKIAIDFKRSGNLRIELNNIASNAELKIDGVDIKSVDENVNGITRELTIQVGGAKHVCLLYTSPSPRDRG